MIRCINPWALFFVFFLLCVFPCFAMEGDSEGDEEDEDFQAMACMFEEEIAVTSEHGQSGFN